MGSETWCFKKEHQNTPTNCRTSKTGTNVLTSVRLACDDRESADFHINEFETIIISRTNRCRVDKRASAARLPGSQAGRLRDGRRGSAAATAGDAAAGIITVPINETIGTGLSQTSLTVTAGSSDVVHLLPSSSSTPSADLDVTSFTGTGFVAHG